MRQRLTYKVAGHLFSIEMLQDSFLWERMKMMEKEIREGISDSVGISVLEDIQGTVLIGAASL